MVPKKLVKKPSKNPIQTSGKTGFPSGFYRHKYCGRKVPTASIKAFHTPIIIPARPSMFPGQCLLIFRTVYISPFINGIGGSIEPIHYLQIKSRIRVQKCNFQFSVIQSPKLNRSDFSGRIISQVFVISVGYFSE